jgi:large subunit ribosomal protein L23
VNYEAVLIGPVLSEKTNKLRENGKFTFRVDPRATKLDIKEACRRLFKVHPTDCNIINVATKPKRLRNRPGRTSAWKKAVVSIPKDEKISLFEGV